jgi:hypothetical protein
MRQSLRWAAPSLAPTAALVAPVKVREDIMRRACGRLNLHKTASARPTASFNLRLSEILATEERQGQDRPILRGPDRPAFAESGSAQWREGRMRQTAIGVAAPGKVLGVVTP